MEGEEQREREREGERERERERVVGGTLATAVAFTMAGAFLPFQTYVSCEMKSFWRREIERMTRKEEGAKGKTSRRKILKRMKEKRTSR